MILELYLKLVRLLLTDRTTETRERERNCLSIKLVLVLLDAKCNVLRIILLRDRILAEILLGQDVLQPSCRTSACTGDREVCRWDEADELVVADELRTTEKLCIRRGPNLRRHIRVVEAVAVKLTWIRLVEDG